MHRHRPLPVKNRWLPSDLGPTAWWTVEPSYVTLSGVEVTNLRNRIDGRSGVLRTPANDPSPGPPTWQSSRPGGTPAIFFSGASALDESTNGFEAASGNQAADIASMAGTDTPFSVLMTTQLTSDQSARTLFLWYWFLGANSLISLEVTGNGLLKVTRRDGTGTSKTLTGGNELGNSIRRIGLVFDGSGYKLYIDAVLDGSNSTAGGLGAITLDAFRLGNAQDPGTSSAAMYLSDFVLVPRAINRNEWLAYYSWSTTRWIRIQPPTFGAAGSGIDGTGTLAVPYPTTQNGDRILTVVAIRSGDGTTDPNTPSGWTLMYGPDVNPAVRLFVYERDSAADGTETGTVSWTFGGPNNSEAAFMVTLRNVSSTTLPASHYESATTTEVDGPGSLSAPTISPNGYGRLAVAVVGIDTSQAMTFTGATGGTWAKAAEFTTTVGGDLGISVHVAALPNPAPISGGTATVSGSDAAMCRGFAVLGT